MKKKDFRMTLILDDELSTLNLLTRVCEQEGHVVRTFMRPTEALECLARDPIDLLITDMHMPEADGITVTEAAWRLRPDLYVLIVTGHAGMFPVERLLDGGHADIMFKPFRLNEFRARLDLARRRRAHVSRISAEMRALHAAGHQKIQQLQRELEGR
jgi:DNA-binding response OmpR family regulator